MICARCRIQSSGSIMSRFNTDTICFDCEKIERAHPEYDDAAETEVEQVRRGNYNFRGVGLPSGFHAWAAEYRTNKQTIV